jgi:hypothetical protein
MHRVQLWLIALMLVWAAPLAPAAPPTPILIELFTSEGCSDCPAADVLLDKLVAAQPVAGAEIIALEQHVDHWDRLGWNDRFSSAAFTNRQQVYGARFGTNNIYTPQMVVDGVPTNSDTGEVSVAAEWQRDAIKVVAFVQERRGRLVLASGVMPLKNVRP